MTTTRPSPSPLARLVDSQAFTTVILAVIVANAAVLGLQTYAGVEAEHGDLLNLLNDVFLVVFVVELVLRLAACGRRPHDFFRSGWNWFDFLVVALAFVPGVRENTTLLRLARLLRVVRLVRLLPDFRLLVTAVWRSLPPLVSIGALTGLILFVYAKIGWLLFHDELPDAWGDLGTAMLTLFLMLTLENFPTELQAGMDVHAWSWVYFVSFVLIAAFVVLNVLIGIVINSMEEARQLEAERQQRERAARGEPEPEPRDGAAARIAAMRQALDELERDLARRPPLGEGEG